MGTQLSMGNRILLLAVVEGRGRPYLRLLIDSGFFIANNATGDTLEARKTSYSFREKPVILAKVQSVLDR